MARLSTVVSRGLVAVALGSAIAFSGGMVHAATPDAGATLDYTIQQKGSAGQLDVIKANIVYNAGKLSGTGVDTSVPGTCPGKFAGTDNKGKANFTLTFKTGSPCSGVVVTFKGVLKKTSGSGTWTNTNGFNGNWTAADPSSSSPAGSGSLNLG